MPNLEEVKKFSEIFKGAINKHGTLDYIDKVTGKKNAHEESQPFPYEAHLSGQLKGLSPVNEETLMCSWGGIDIDLPLSVDKFPGEIWSKIGTRFFCFLTPSKRWRVLDFFDEPMPVEQANEYVKNLEAEVAKKLNIKVDTVSTAPTIPSEKGAVGRWFFLPYSFDYDVCYSPGGNPLSLQQFFFRYKYRSHPIVVAAVGMTGKGEVGSRSKALFNVALYKKHFECDVSLEELNLQFATKLNERDFLKEEKHVLKTCEKYDQKYFINGQSKWIKEMTGHRPCLDAKGLVVIPDGLVAAHIYILSRTGWYETSDQQFLSKEQLNDWYKSEYKDFSGELLKNSATTKVKSYFTHPGLPPGVVYIEPGEIKGFKPGEYLNIYQKPDLKAVKGEYQQFDDYYCYLLGEDNWKIEKQKLAFNLNAESEHQHYLETGYGGLKTQWFSIWHSKAHGVGKGLFALFVQAMFGPANVRTNVKFDQLIDGHSTIIDGAQTIFLNEVALNNTSKMKDKSEKIKDIITEPEIMVNPKFKDPVHIPNLANFYMFSNSDKPMHIAGEDRRTFVIDIDKPKEQIVQRLAQDKDAILKAIQDPSAFKYHLLNDITYDRKMFFEDAPMNKAKENIIYANKDDFVKVMDECFADKTFPFCSEWTKKYNGDLDEYWSYEGFLNTKKTFFALKKHQDFKNLYFNLESVESYLKDNCCKWPNGKLTVQLRCANGSRPRVYLMEHREHEGKLITDMTDRELGILYETRKGFDVC
ncbi:primase-helicase family protein [Candidatus Pelagibacter sp. HIMB1746]|uniref:primase-helicase family protein n=1 Tax=unclassified Candidatus Pelagibacter TaxID=2647897 RepID=UPI003F85F803